MAFVSDFRTVRDGENSLMQKKNIESEVGVSNDFFARPKSVKADKA